MSRRLLAPAAAAALLLLAGCGSGDAPIPAGAAPEAAEPDTAAITVVSSTNVYGAVATAIGGDRVEVKSIIEDPAADPHSYESTPADAAALVDADIVVANGGGYDDFMTGLISASGAEPTVIDVSELSGLVPAEDAAAVPTDDPAHDDEHGHEHGGDGHSHEDGHSHGEFNEHVWYDLNTMGALAVQMATDFTAADAEGAEQYRSNAEAFTTEIAALLEQTQAIGAPAGTRVALTEPVPGYLLATAGLTDATPPQFASSVEADTDPPVAVLQQTLELFSGPDPVQALILNSQTQTPVTDQVRQAAQAADVPVVDMSETLPEGVTSYTEWMQGQIDELAQAVGSTAPGA